MDLSGDGSSGTSWWAYVMYARDRVKQYVPVTDIYEEIGPKASRQRRPFTPRNTRDFNPNVLYVIKTTVGNPKDDTKKHSYYGFIGRLDVSKEDLQASVDKKRVGFPSFGEGNENEPESSSSDTSRSRPLLGVEAVIAVRDGKKRQDEVRRARQNAELDSIVSQTVSAISPLSSGPSDDSEAMREEIRRLKLALAEKEAELQSKAESVDTASIVDGIKAEMTANFKDLEQRLFQLVDDKMNDVLRKSSQPSSQLVEEWLNNSPL